MRLSAGIAAAVAVACVSSRTPAASVGSVAPAAVLQVIATRQEYDALIPWQKRQPVERSGYGVLVAPGRVLTTENLVRQHSLVETVAERSGRRMPARVLMADEQVNLALLALDEADAVACGRPCEVAADNPGTNALRVVQFDQTREVQSGGAQLLRISMDMLPTANYASLALDILTDLNVNGEGAPVFDGERLTGLVFSYSSSSRTGRGVPVQVLRRFIADAGLPAYAGFASCDFLWRSLVDPARRQWLGVTDTPGGILVMLCVAGGGASAVLQPNDVITTWDGCAIDDLGYYTDPEFGRLLFPYLIKGRRRPGDRVPVTLVRERRPLSVEVTVRRVREGDMLIPDNTTGQRDEYLVEGGFLLREATGRYLQAYGPDWQNELDPALVHLYLTRKLTPERPGQRVVLLASVLPHPINNGYQQFGNRMVTHVNGKAVDNLREVFRIRDGDGHIERVTLKGVGVDLVLSASDIDRANAELMDIYGLSSLQWRRTTDPETASR